MKRRFLALLCILLVVSSFMFVVCSDNILAQAKGNKDQSQINSLDELNVKTIGVQTGSINGPAAEARFPDSRVNYFNSQTDILTALGAGKIDAWCAEEPIARFMRIDNPWLSIVGEPLQKASWLRNFQYHRLPT